MMQNNPQVPPPYQGPAQYPPPMPPPYQTYPPALPNQGYPQMPPHPYQPGLPNQQGVVPKPQPMQRQRVRRRLSGPAMMIRGAIMAAIGLVLTIVSYSIVAGSGGGTYVVFSGLIVIGVIYFIIGFFRSLVRR